ncbi:MAG: hypothetical protein J7501_15755, partial [Bdellovibrio sp.]|nr:hypothetical protein [Bdellovibrio sp.]
MMKSLGILLVTFGLAPAFAQSNNVKPKPLFFPADKNNLQVLPQRFEYTLMDEDRLKVGDILVDSTQVTFQLIPPTEKNGTYRVRFTWPAELLKEGELAIKNNSGKAIFTTSLDQENVKISNNTHSEDETLRANIASLTVDLKENQIVDDMKYLPFMTFCIYRQSEDTKIYLCSKELYLSAQQGGLEVKPRSATKKTAQVEINGKVVGNQGIIYLNDRSESVAFKALTQTGAFLEIETRMNNVDFKDVTVSENGRIILTAAGAEPADPAKSRKLPDGSWQAVLSKERPVLYLKGDGDIPMRQEFYIRGNLPTAKLRPFVSAKAVTKTYASSVSMQGLTPEGVTVSGDGTEKTASLQAQGKNFTWDIHELPTGKASRHYVNVQSGEDKFVAGYDIHRGNPFALFLGVRYQAPSGIAFGSVGFQWWIENFLGLQSDWSRLHWGLSLTHDQHLTTNDDTAEVDFTTLELLWRAQPGFHLEDETWGLSLPIQNVKGESANSVAYGLGAFWQFQPKTKWLKNWMAWSEFKLQYFPSGSGSDFKVKSAYRLEGNGYTEFKHNFF